MGEGISLCPVASSRPSLTVLHCRTNTGENSPNERSLRVGGWHVYSAHHRWLSAPILMLWRFDDREGCVGAYVSSPPTGTKPRAKPNPRLLPAIPASSIGNGSRRTAPPRAPRAIGNLFPPLEVEPRPIGDFGSAILSLRTPGIPRAPSFTDTLRYPLSSLVNLSPLPLANSSIRSLCAAPGTLPVLPVPSRDPPPFASLLLLPGPRMPLLLPTYSLFLFISHASPSRTRAVRRDADTKMERARCNRPAIAKRHSFFDKSFMDYSYSGFYPTAPTPP